MSRLCCQRICASTLLPPLDPQYTYPLTSATQDGPPASSEHGDGDEEAVLNDEVEDDLDGGLEDAHIEVVVLSLPV